MARVLCTKFTLPHSKMSQSEVISPECFEIQGHGLIQRAPGLGVVRSNRRFRSMFGVSPEVCAKTWNKLGSLRPENSEPRHLLWTLLFLKVYATETVNAAICSVDEKTFRTWVRKFVTAISQLRIVSCIDF